MSRRKVVHYQRVQVPSGQATERPVADPSLGKRFLGPSGVSKAVLKRKQERGPQHQVKPTASTDLQSRSRSAHFTGEATSVTRLSESAGAAGPGGVLGAARGQGEVRNARGPSAQREQPQGYPYKPMAKSGAVQRESEGAVVLVMAPTNNDAGGKGPCFSHAEHVGTREGLSGKTGSNHPDGRTVVVQFKAQEPGSARLRERAKPLAQATRRGLSASRVREIRTHGLTGGPVSYLLMSNP